MHFKREQREAWSAETKDSPFNDWLRERTRGVDGLLDLERLREVALEFGVDATRYAHLNAGQQRMNVGNRLRSVVPAHVYGGPAKRTCSVPAGTRMAPSTGPDPRWPELVSAPALELLRLQAAAVDELRRRGVVRTGNAPLGDYAEHLFARAFGWTLTANSTSSHDAVDADGVRYQIKARRLRTDASGERQLGVMRGLPDAGFETLAAVLFDREFNVRRAALVPHVTVLARAVRVGHVNGWRFMLEDAVWGIDGVKDVTAELHAASTALGGNPEAP